MAENPLTTPLRPLLEAKGFKRRGSQVKYYLRTVRPGLHAYVSLNWASYPGEVHLNPKVGVRHDEVERLTAELLGWDPKGRAFLPTVWTTLSLLVPQDRPHPRWVVRKDEGDRNAEVWQQLADDVDEYAEPWWAARADDEGLLTAMDGTQDLSLAAVARPVLLWLSGRDDEAREAIERGRHVTNLDGRLIDYDAYAERLLAEMELAGNP